MGPIEATDRTEWREWLREKCDTADEVWLVIRHARCDTPSVRHGEAVEEARERRIARTVESAAGG